MPISLYMLVNKVANGVFLNSYVPRSIGKSVKFSTINKILTIIRKRFRECIQTFLNIFLLQYYLYCAWVSRQFFLFFTFFRSSLYGQKITLNIFFVRTEICRYNSIYSQHFRRKVLIRRKI